MHGGIRCEEDDLRAADVAGAGRWPKNKLRVERAAISSLLARKLELI